MKKVYGCDVWDGLGSVFNKIVALSNTKTWDVLTGNSLLKKRGLDKMNEGSEDVCRTLGMFPGVAAGAFVTYALDLGPESIGYLAPIFIFASMALGVATATLPRNAYVACKARKKADTEHEANGFRPQPPDAW